MQTVWSMNQQWSAQAAAGVYDGHPKMVAEETGGLQHARGTNGNPRSARRHDFQIRRGFSRRTRAERVEKLTPRAMPCTRNSFEAPMSFPSSPSSPLSTPNAWRIAYRRFSNESRQFSGPDSPLSPRDGIFLVFRLRWIPRAISSARLGSLSRADL